MKKILLIGVSISGLLIGTAIPTYSYFTDKEDPIPQKTEAIILAPQEQAASPSAEQVLVTEEATPTPTPTPTPSPTPKVLTDEEKKKICDEMVEKFKESKKGDLSKITPELQAKKEEIKKNAEEELKKLNCDRRTSECSEKFQQLKSTIKNPKVEGINENEILARFSEEVSKFKYENCPK